MDINTLVKLTNQKLAGETLLYSQLEPYFDDVIDKINTELNAIFPTFSEHRARNQTDSGIPAYTYFPDMYIRSVVVVGAAVGFYTVDEEGIITAQQMQVEYNTNLFMMKRDYSEQVPEKYKATGRGYLTGGNFYVNTDCKQCMSANNGHCPKTCGIMDLFPELRYVPIQGPQGPAGASVIVVSDTEPTDKACKIWIKAYEDYAEVYTRNDTGSFVYLTKILSKADVDKLQNAVSFDGTITLSEVNSEQCHTNRGVFKILTSDNNTYGGILMAWHIGPDTTANRQLLIKPTFQGTSMIRFRKYANGVWQPWTDVIDTASYAKTSDLDTHINDTNNPHKLTKATFGLDKVDNTADADKAVLSAKKLYNTRQINGVDFDGTEDITVEDTTKIPLTQKGRPNGVATLGSDGLVLSSQLPTYLDDTIKSISANGSAIVPDENKNVNITIPTKLSQFTNDSGYATESFVTDKIELINDDIVDSRKAIEELSDKKITKFYANSLGAITLNDSDNGKIQDMMLYGKSLQDGTPTPDSPVEIQSVVNPVVKVYGKKHRWMSDYQFNWFMNNTDDWYKPNIAIVIYNTSSGYWIRLVKKDTLGNYYRKIITRIDVFNWNKENDNYNKKIYEGKSSSEYLYANTEFITVNSVKTMGLPQQTATLPYTLNAIPVSSGGNVTIDNQQYVADYVDIKNNQLHRLVDSSKFDNTVSIVDNTDLRLSAEQVINIAEEEVKAFKELATYYSTTNVSVTSDQLEGYTTFNYPISLANGWNYVKEQIGDTRGYIYDMELQSAEAYVNSEYAVALAELEV